MTTYYISAAGNNSNNGTSTGTSWADTTNVNTTAYQGGDSVLFNGGDTISGAISIAQANWGGTNTWDASHKNANITLSGLTNNTLVATQTANGSNDCSFYATLPNSSGKFIYSYVLTVMGAHGVDLGIGTATRNVTTGQYLGIDTATIGYTPGNGGVFTNTSTLLGTAATGAQGSRIWFAIDLTAKLIWIRVNNGNWNNSGTANPDTGVGGFDISGLASFAAVYPAAGTWTLNDAITVDFNTAPGSGSKATTFSLWNANNPSPSSQVTFGSYGTGVATISSGSATWGWQSISISNFTVQSLNFTGPDQTTDKHGMFIYNNIQQDHHLPAFTLSNLTVSTYGDSGIEIFGNITGSGFDNIVVQNCTVHHTGGGVAGSTGGIVLFGLTLGTGWTEPAFTNALITNCVVHDQGLVSTAFATGAPSGIVLGQALNSTVQFCTVYNTGLGITGTGQPNAIWTYDSIGSILQFNEAYNSVGGGSATWSAAGIDLDVHCQNCIAEYNYSHDNDGPGLMVIAFSEAGYTNNLNSVVRYNITQNNGKSTADNAVGGEIALINGHGSTTSVLTGLQVYNNTCYSSAAAALGCVVCVGPDFSGTTGNVANNIFYTTGAKFVTFVGSATATSGSAFLFSGNNYFTTGSFSLTWGATNYTSFAAWVAAVTAQEPVAQRLTSPTANPGLLNPGGGGNIGGYEPSSLAAYHLQGNSPLIGTGLNLSTMYSISPGQQDYYGSPIPISSGTGYCVGAWSPAPIVITYHYNLAVKI